MRLRSVALRFFSAVLTAVMIFAAFAPTAKAITMEEIGSAIGPIAAQYAEAYKKAYQQAKEDGVIDQINVLLDEVKKVFDDAEEWLVNNSEVVTNTEFVDAIKQTTKNMKVSIDTLRELINNADELDSETASYAMNLINALYVNITDLFELLQVVAMEVSENIDPEIAEIIAKAQESIAQLQKDASEVIAELQQQAEEMIGELVKNAEEKIGELQRDAEKHLAALEALLKEADGDAREAILEEIRQIEEKLRADIAEIEKMLEEETAAVTMWLIDAIAQINQNLNLDIEAVISQLGETVSALKSVVAEIAKFAEENETIKAVLKYIEDEMKKMRERADNYVKEMFKKYTTSSYRVSDTSLYLAIGNDIAYAKMFADNVYLKPYQFASCSWDSINPELIKKADLISVSFNEDLLSGFAVNQALGYVSDYINAEMRDDFVEYVAAAMTQLLSSTTPAFKPTLVEKCVVAITEAVNMGIDQFCEVQLGGNTAQPLDWAEIVGEENVASIENTRDLLKDKLFSSGIEEVYSYEISVVDLIYDNLDLLDDGGVGLFLKYVEKNDIIELLGEYATYTVKIPLSDAIMFAGESYIYSYAQFTQNYSKTVTMINELNSNANVVLLGHYNSFGGIELTIEETTVDFGSVYKDFARLTCIHPFAYAVFMDNVTYIDVFDAETVYKSKLASGEDMDALAFLFSYMTDRSLTNISEAGHSYVCQRMLESISVERGEPPLPVIPEEPEDETPLWVMILIASGAAVVVLAGGSAVCWFGIRKKRTSKTAVKTDKKNKENKKKPDKKGQG